MSRSSGAVNPPREAAAASMCANFSASSTNCTRAVPSKVTATTVVAIATGVSAVIVSGVDLTQYVQSPSEATPFERFLKDENRLERLASSPWLCRITKL